MIGHTDVQPAMGAQPVGALVAGRAGRAHVDQDLQAVQVVAGLLAQQAVLEDVEPVDVVDALAGPVGQGQGRSQQLRAALDHLPAPPVESGIDHHVGAGGHQQVGARGQMGTVHEIALDMEDRSLLESGTHLVDAHNADIRAPRPSPK